MRLARTALDVLANISDDRVRELGATLISERRWIGRAVGLLVRNAQPGDYRMLEQLLGDASLDEETYHGLETGVRDLAQAHRSVDAERSLLLAYENGPCSLCRRDLVKELIEIGRLPVRLWEECAYDVHSETRCLVGKCDGDQGD